MQTGITWTLLFRASTNVGMMRLLEDHPDILQKGKRIIHAPANDIDSVEETLCAKAYTEYCYKLWERNKNPIKCLHCGKPISEKTNYFVEIDNMNLEPYVGIVHKECLKSIDRVIGGLRSDFFDKYNFLKKFDVETWAHLIRDGQGVFNALNSGNFGPQNGIGWSSTYEYNATYNYCIRFTLEDGSYEYAYQRGKVLRLREKEAKEKAEYMNVLSEEARKQKNPFCFTTKKKTFGPYNIVIGKKDDDEKCLECILAEPIKYNINIEKSYNLFKNYYAPICMLLLAESEDFFMINNHLVLITDPLNLNEYINNWKRAGIELDEYEIKIIENDKDFDERMRYSFKHGLQVIVNPLLDYKKNFIKGIPVVDFNQLIESS